MVKEHGFVHLSAGDLLRAERDSGSKNAKLIEEFITAGKIVPAEITCGLIRAAMKKTGWASSKYLVDGYPRD